MDFSLIFYLLAFGLFIYFMFSIANEADKGYQRNQQPQRYHPSGPLFTPAERSFYGALTLAVGEKAKIFGKVRIADILKPDSNLTRSEWQVAFNKISRKHFDFVLCRNEDLSVICTIELDDKSHNSPTRIERDELVDSACASAGLTLHRFKARRTYNPNEISSLIFKKPAEFGDPEAIIASSAKSEDNAIPLNTDPPLNDLICPKCFSDLDKKLSEYGTNKGKTILVCTTFPECKYVKIT